MIDNSIKILSDREHVIKRPAMYIGSVSSEPIERFVFGKFRSVTYVPGLVKIIDEIIDNSIDEAIRTSFKHANTISVDIKDSQVTVSDNGRGIPQTEVITPEGDKIPGPVAAWTRTKAGGNFGDDGSRITAGMNGVGSALTNFFSSEFKGITCDGKHTITVKCSSGAENVDYKISKGTKAGTSVQFTPDFAHFECSEITTEVSDIIQDRLMALSVAFPDITFKFNGKKIKSSFKKYAEQYGETVISRENDNVSIGILTSEDGFRQVSYVNGLFTKNGGAHIDWLMDEISIDLIPKIKRKHKIDVSKARIKECLTVLIFVRGMPDLKFDGQTKERLTNTWGEIKNHFDIDTQKISSQIMNNDDILMPIIEAALARKLASEKAAATRAAKHAAKAKVVKHVKANLYGKDSADTVLFLTEGDSAINPFLVARNHDTQGGYPLRGRFLSTWGMKEVDMIKNSEVFDIMAITGLKFGETVEFYDLPDGAWYKVGNLIVNENDEVFDKTWVPVDLTNAERLRGKIDKETYESQENVRRRQSSDLNYTNIAIMTDADVDGQGSIYPALLAFFAHWPELFEHGCIRFCKTPLIILQKGTEQKWFYNAEEYDKVKSSLKGWSEPRYIKGLGSLQESEYERIMKNPVYDVVRLPDNYTELFDMLFGNDANLRKEWMKAV